MAERYAVFVEGLSALTNLESLPADIIQAARRAVNDTTKRGHAAGGRAIREQVNFPARYVTGQDGRLRVKRLATGANLEGVIEGRQRPTSLARFVSGSTAAGKGGVSVAVKPGGARFMRRAFLMRLRSGGSLTDTQHNLGLAIRVKDGESIHNKQVMAKALESGPNSSLYLLYGPSIDQVFRTVASDIGPDLEDFMERTFLRLLEIK